MFRFFRITVAVTLLAALAPTSHANAIRFSYLGDAPGIDGALAPAVGDTLTFDVIFDFDDVTFGGGFDVRWDSDVLGLTDLSVEMVGDPFFGREPDVFDGLLRAWSVGDFAGLTGEIRLGTVSFAYLGGMTDLRLIQGSGGCNCWPDAEDPVTGLTVEFGQVAIVPVPAAVWLMGSALGMLLVSSRRASAR